MEKIRVFISGANRGIGLAITKVLVEQGDIVFAGYRNRSDAEELFDVSKAAPLQCYPVKVDITSDEDTFALKRFIEFLQPVLDVVINNAGVDFERENPGLLDVDLATVQNTYNINALGALRVSKALLPLLKHSAFPRIVNVTSRI
jgi:NAD(P)-dependent dehydrogenase (short-subunit alcohol dehydrogenase family)